MNLPEENLIYFLEKHSPTLRNWQREILRIVRNVAQYFYPQMQTKVCNEGWASFWHARIMRELALTNEEYTDFAVMNAGVLAPSRHSMSSPASRTS